MLTVDTRGGAIALLVIGLILLGTWGALLNLAERKGRSTTHTFIDFCIAFFLVSLVCALTLGQFGNSSTDGRQLENFIYQLQHSSEKKPLIGFAMGAGVCIFFGNLGLQLALTLCGVTIAVPLFSSFLVIIGTSLNWAEDKGLNAARILFPGVVCFFLAFVAGSITHLLNERHISRQKQLMDQSGAIAPHGTTAKAGAPGPKTSSKEVDDSAHGQSQAFSKGSKDGDSDTDPLDQAEAAGGAARLPGPRHAVANVQHEWADPDAEARSVRLSPAQKRFWGIIVASLAGAVGSLFSPGFNVVTNDTFHTLAPGVQPLTVYTGYFWFCVPFIPLCIVQCSIFMRWPILGQKRTTWMAWLKDHKDFTWFWGFLSGVLVSAANVLQFLGGQAAGYAASDLVQANPIIATLWGIFLFHEFHRSTTSKLTYVFLACMYALYIGAVVLLAISAKARN